MNRLQSSWLIAQDKKLSMCEANSAAAFSNLPEQLDYIAYAASGKRASECFDS